MAGQGLAAGGAHLDVPRHLSMVRALTLMLKVPGST
jgi:hypothetical protein